MIIMVVGPIDYWWSENWNTEDHHSYMGWRTLVCASLVEAGHLVYRPHEAFKGAWSERAQAVNNMAITISDLLLDIRPPGVPAYGTDAEIEYAKRSGVPVFKCPPGTELRTFKVLVPGPIYLFDRLDDPYGDVHRKSYTR
jgi:hypothetical protein